MGFFERELSKVGSTIWWKGFCERKSLGASSAVAWMGFVPKKSISIIDSIFLMSNFPKNVTKLALKITVVLYPIIFISLELCSFPSSKKKKYKFWGS